MRRGQLGGPALRQVGQHGIQAFGAMNNFRSGWAAEEARLRQQAVQHTIAGNAQDAMAAEQWLRQVPDDPGGLWRRKFRYQYQRLYGGQSGSAEPW